MSEQSEPEPTPREQPEPEPTPREQAEPEPTPRQQPEPELTPRRSWTSRVRGMSTTAKVIYSGAAVFVVAVLAVALTGLASGKAAKTGPPPLAKAFTLPELGDPGHTVSLAQYAGRPLIINFFASWCTNCKTETPMIASYYKRMAGKVIVLGIDADDEKGPALKFVSASGVAYPVGFEPTNQTVADAYNVYGIPQTFFLDAQHRIVKHVSGALTMKELINGVALMDKSEAD